MRIHSLPIFSALLMFASAAFAADFKLAYEDRIPVINGERTFVLGLYENPKDDAVLAEVAAAGFNLVQAEASKAALDRVSAHNLFAWINTGTAIELQAGNQAAGIALKQMADAHKSHPALLVWEVPDEALWNIWLAAQQWRHEEEPRVLGEKISALGDENLKAKLAVDMALAAKFNRQGEYGEAEKLADSVWEALGEQSPKAGIGLSNAQDRADKLAAKMVLGAQMLKRFDPSHQVWMNHAPRNQIEQLATFNAAADIVGCDIYPVPQTPLLAHSDLNNKSLSCVGEYTRRMLKAGNGKPVWMVLQGFGWKDLDGKRPEELRRPTKEETRFMAWDAVANGATGVLYWGTAYIEKDSELWKNILEVVRELADSQAILSAPQAEINAAIRYAPTYGSRENGIAMIAKKVGDETVFIMANEENIPLKFTLGGLEALEGVQYRERAWESVNPTVEKGEITLGMPPYSVFILEPQK